MTKKITSFTDLVAWKEGHLLVLAIYQLTSKFPKEESFSLTDQMRRSAISITSNIAEGFSRMSRKEKRQFDYMALGSTSELQNQLLIAKDLHYVSEDEFSRIASQIITVHKLINGLIKSSQTYSI